MRNLLVLALVLTGGAAEARNVLDTHFNSRGAASDGCFVRSYTRAHLAQHPRQTVRQMMVIRSAERAPQGGVVVDVLVAVNAPDPTHAIQASCTARGDRQVCVNTDGSQGGFTLSAAKNGALLMQLMPQGLVFGAADNEGVWLQGDAGDDREFLIPNVDQQNCM
ncbi:hypothetical protein GEU84_002435 [Fertoebacter nigrum]|uniref:Uncharacterized protein n=1 Tax=Fertoeibacter niger TaxID=2656921 RepID=A0A8X8GZ94_9RHOB|nr:hypothetical protein [Fertoeibacter niger]NUB43229.1 hypothetical protein [Fertoeibacter niger]